VGSGAEDVDLRCGWPGVGQFPRAAGRSG
jgi:hypothetical protein